MFVYLITFLAKFSKVEKVLPTTSDSTQGKESSASNGCCAEDSRQASSRLCRADARAR